MAKVIFLNAPPRAGKDSFCELICEIAPKAKRFAFADSLKRDTHQHFGLDRVDPHQFENVKDEPNSLFRLNGDAISPRQAYIFYSEEIIKPQYGLEYFGKRLMGEMAQEPEDTVFVITDSGFLPEAEPIIEHYGINNCLLVHINRYNCHFTNDSRSFWEKDGLELVNLDNNGESLCDLKTTVEEFCEIKGLVNGK